MKTFLDWSAYQDAGMGDAYADIPKTGGDFAKAVAVCINSGACEKHNDKGVMCPSFRIGGDSRLSTGARVRLLKAALNHELGEQLFVDPDLRLAMDLCVSCKGCKRECENAVDMALIKIEYLAQLNEQEGLSLRARLFAHIPFWLHRWPWLGQFIVWRNAWPVLAKLGEKLLGIAAHRQLPVPVATAFQAPAAPPDAGRREVVLLVDTFSRHFDPDVADAALAVLQAAGYRVIVAEPAQAGRPLCCGRTYLAQGMVAQAQAEARHMLAALLPHVEAGRPIIGLEPSCLLTLRDEYSALDLGTVAARVAGHTLLFEEFIAREHTANALHLKLKPLDKAVLVHGHCHQKAVGAMKSMRKVLKLIPGLQFEMVESSCCGMAGSFGLEAEHAAVSWEMARQSLLPKLSQAPDSLVLSNGFSCRRQIAEGDGRAGLHLAQLLRDALA
ncbi:MAG: (Fe-S)-binding protein [Methylococcaceae bacterium]|nr:MAG: (Fe-S)-binding protein [Methylococcaceae bacterium]